MNGQTIERIRKLCDPGSFEPRQPATGQGFLLGRGTIDERPVHLLAADIDTPLAVPLPEAFSRVSDFLDAVAENPAPLVQLLDVQADFRAASGATLVPAGGLELLAHERCMGRVYSSLGRLEGVVPRVSVILGPTGASRSFPAALCDAAVMLDSAALCLGRPDAVRHMTGQEASFAELGGPQVQARESGTVHKVVRTEQAALAWVRGWLAHLPTSADGSPPEAAPRAPRAEIGPVAESFRQGLNTSVDMHRLIDAVADGGSWLEMGELHAGECITGMARIEGRGAGILASNAAVRGGILHPESCRKMTRFIRLCGRFGLPLVFLADTPGFMVGAEVERGGIVQAASELYTAIAASPSPRVCVVVRKAYSAGLYAMAGPGFDSTFWALPEASVSIMGPDALRRFGQGGSGEDMPAPLRRAMEEMLAAATDPGILAEKGLVDDTLEWADLRPRLAGFLRGDRP